MTQRLDAEARAAEEAEIATWLHDHGATKLRKRPANAPPIAKIREALRKAGELTVSRAGGRKIKFRAQPLNDAANLAGGSQPHKPASVTRRNRRAANKLSARS